MDYIGNHDLAIDSKNRLSIPSSIRAEIDAESEGEKLVLAPGLRHGTLGLFIRQDFQAFRRHLDESLEDGPEKTDFMQFFNAMATPLERDKQGRVVLPANILNDAGIKKQVTLAGNGEHFVLWNREDFKVFASRGWQRHPDILEQSRLKTKLSKVTNGMM